MIHRLNSSRFFYAHCIFVFSSTLQKPKLAQTDMLLTCMLEMTRSNVGQYIEYTDGSFRGFCQFLQAHFCAIPELVQGLNSHSSFYNSTV
jgi:hypothetical protein